MKTEHFERWKNIVMSPRRILLVEDSSEDVAMILGMSRDFNIEFVVANNYEQAMEALRDCKEKAQTGHGFTLIILDLNLQSQPTGEDVFCRVKEDCPLIPIVVLSGYISMESVSRMSKMGFVMFTPKPPSFSKKWFEQLYTVFNVPKRIQVAI